MGRSWRAYRGAPRDGLACRALLRVSLMLPFAMALLLLAPVVASADGRVIRHYAEPARDGADSGFTTSRSNVTDDHEEEESTHSNEDRYVMLFIALTLLIGALMRHLLKDSKVPYTVILLVVGIMAGLLGKNWDIAEHHTRIANIDPHLLLFIFLPLLLFESSFSLEFHVFKKSIVSILMLAVPGVVLATGLTAVLVKYMFPHDWTFTTYLLLGAILAATDPVAVVALLRDLGASKTLATLIEGESLLNDGTAIVIFLVLQEVVVEEHKGHSNSIDPLTVVWNFFFVALGGPIVGWIVGKLTVRWLGRVFNDALVEITITLGMTYFVFYVSEEIVHVSGVLAVVVFGLVINSTGRSRISTEVEHFLHRFYEMTAYLANTLIFTICGLVAAYKTTFGITEVGYLLLLYVICHVVRAVVVLMLTPFLRRVGYGLHFGEGCILVYGGLRGGVGLALALLVALEIGGEVGSLILFYVAGMVVLTLVVNGTTIQNLLHVLKMDRPSAAKLHMLRSAIEHLRHEARKKLAALKRDPFLGEADWKNVRGYWYYPHIPHKPTRRASRFPGTGRLTSNKNKNNNINNTVNVIPRDVGNAQASAQANLSEDVEDNNNRGALHKQGSQVALAIQRQSTLNSTMGEDKLRMIRFDAYRRFNKAIKQNYWHQFEIGQLGQNAVLLLSNITDEAVDIDGKLVEFEDIEHMLAVPVELQQKYDRYKDTAIVGAYYRKRVFDRLFLAFHIGLGYIRAQEEVQQLIMAYDSEQDDDGDGGDPTTGGGTRKRSPSNRSASSRSSSSSSSSVGDSHSHSDSDSGSDSRSDGETAAYRSGAGSNGRNSNAKKSQNKNNHGKSDDSDGDGNNVPRQEHHVAIRAGCATEEQERRMSLTAGRGEADIAEKLKQQALSDREAKDTARRQRMNASSKKQGTHRRRAMKDFSIITNPEIAEETHAISVVNTELVLLRILLLREAHPEISVAIKTVFAAKRILDHEKSMIMHLREGGALDEDEGAKLLSGIEGCLKRLYFSPPRVSTPGPEALLSETPWLQGVGAHTISKIIKASETLTFQKAEYVMHEGEDSDGMYMIVGGVVRIERDGQLLAIEGPGTIFGELSVLTGGERKADVKAETYVTATFLSNDTMRSLISAIPNLRTRLWAYASIKMSETMLARQAPFCYWKQEQLRLWVQSGEFVDFEKDTPRVVAHVLLEVEYLAVLLKGSVYYKSEERGLWSREPMEGPKLFWGPCTMRVDKHPKVMFFSHPDNRNMAMRTEPKRQLKRMPSMRPSDSTTSFTLTARRRPRMDTPEMEMEAVLESQRRTSISLMSHSARTAEEYHGGDDGDADSLLSAHSSNSAEAAAAGATARSSTTAGGGMGEGGSTSSAGGGTGGHSRGMRDSLQANVDPVSRSASKSLSAYRSSTSRMRRMETSTGRTRLDQDHQLTIAIFQEDRRATTIDSQLDYTPSPLSVRSTSPMIVDDGDANDLVGSTDPRVQLEYAGSVDSDGHSLPHNNHNATHERHAHHQMGTTKQPRKRIAIPGPTVDAQQHRFSPHPPSEQRPHLFQTQEHESNARDDSVGSGSSLSDAFLPPIQVAAPRAGRGDDEQMSSSSPGSPVSPVGSLRRKRISSHASSTSVAHMLTSKLSSQDADASGVIPGTVSEDQEEEQ